MALKLDGEIVVHGISLGEHALHDEGGIRSRPDLFFRLRTSLTLGRVREQHSLLTIFFSEFLEAYSYTRRRSMTSTIDH